MPVMVDLDGVTDGTTAAAGTLEIPAGMSMDSGNTAFACADDGADCTVVITVDADDSTVSATSTGGTVTAGNSATYQAELDAAGRGGSRGGDRSGGHKADCKSAWRPIRCQLRTDADIGGSTAFAIRPGEDGSYALSIERDSMATTVTVTANGADADGDDAVEFIVQDMELA